MMMALGDTARFINGAPFKPTDWGDNGLPIIRIQNLTGTGDKFNFTTRQVKPELIVEPGDLLVSWSATLDVYRWTGPRGLLNQHIFKVLPNPGVDADYLYFALKNALVELSSKTHGSTMKHVVRGDFESTQVRVPSNEEQRHIVDLLSRADGIVSLRREALKKSAELIPAIFLDLFGDPATNPKAWPTATLGDVSALVTSGSTPRGGADVYVDRGPMFIRSQNVLMNALDLTTVARIPDSIHREMSRTQVRIGDVLLNITGASIGRVAWVSVLQEDANVNQHVCIVRPKSDVVEAAYLSVCLSQPYHQRTINTVQAGASRQALNHAQVRAFTIAVPSIERQREFAERVTQVQAISAVQETGTARAQQAFEALLKASFH